MKETILDVLLYLFENYFYDDPDAVRDRDSLQAGLIQAGFTPTEVSKAFDWLDELARQRPACVPSPEAVRGPVRPTIWPPVGKSGPGTMSRRASRPISGSST